MSADIERTVRDCAACALYAPRPRRSPLLQHEVPALPWHKLASDIFEYRKKKYIILVDYFSNYMEVGQLAGITSRHVIDFMIDQFARHGIPTILVTDNGPAYSSLEFKKFLREWEIEQETFSPLYPQSNGKSERTVQSVKNMLKRCVDSGQDYRLSLLNFRATPRNGLDSPAQILMGRRLNTRLPITSGLLTEKVDNERNYKVLMTNRENIKKHYDKSAKSVKPFSLGDNATLINNGVRKSVTVVGHASQPRSYFVEDEYGNRFRRMQSQLVVRTTRRSGTSKSYHLSQPGVFQAATVIDRLQSFGIIRRRRHGRVAKEQQTITVNSENTSSLHELRQATGSLSPNTVTSDDKTAILNDSDKFESPRSEDDMSATSSSPSPPAVLITRSKERTARMLANLQFD